MTSGITWCGVCGVMEATHYYPMENQSTCRDHRHVNRTQNNLEALVSNGKLKYEVPLTDEAIDLDPIKELPIDDLRTEAPRDPFAETEVETTTTEENLPVKVTDPSTLKVGDVVSADVRNWWTDETLHNELHAAGVVYEEDGEWKPKHAFGKNVKGTIVKLFNPPLDECFAVVDDDEGKTHPLFWDTAPWGRDKYRKDDTTNGVWLHRRASSQPEEEWVWATEELKEGQEFQHWWRYGNGKDTHAYDGVVIGTNPRKVRITALHAYKDDTVGNETEIDFNQPFSWYKVKAQKDSSAIAAFKELRTLLDGSEQQKWEEVHANDIRVGDIIKGAGRHSYMYEGKYRYGNASRQGKVVRLATEAERKEMVACWIHDPHEEKEIPMWALYINRLVQAEASTSEWPDTIVWHDDSEEDCERCGVESGHYCCTKCKDGDDLCMKCKLCTHCTEIPGKVDSWGDPLKIYEAPCAAGGSHSLQGINNY